MQILSVVVAVVVVVKGTGGKLILVGQNHAFKHLWRSGDVTPETFVQILYAI